MSVKVGIIMGSQSDWSTMKNASDILDELGVAYETKIVSAHRTPDRLWTYGKEAAGRGLKVIIAGAGGAAHLPGMMASKTRVPVIGVPVQTRALSGVDSLYSIVQMPKASPSPPWPSVRRARPTRASWPPRSSPMKTPTSPRASMPGATPFPPPFPTSRPMTDQTPAPLQSGATIGILGGGQLGRMLSVAASRLGFKTCVYEPGGDCPASHVANYHFQASYEDEDALKKFAASVDVVTYEFENVPTSALDLIESLVPIRPNRRALAVSQDRLVEKAFLAEQGLNVAPYTAVDDEADLAEAIAEIGTPAILKTRRFGYDGKGQARIMSEGDAASALNDMAGAEAILEGFVEFTHEVSVIAARGQAGDISCFDPGENVHRDGILHTTTIPARLTPAQRTDAVLLAAKILNALDYVGVMGVELFVTRDGLVVNEIAPRVHNSGHWTQNGCTIDQFEQHIRAVVGWPLGDGKRHSNVEMLNLIGDDVDRIPEYAKDGAVGIHLYGKAEVKAGRKMGHINRITGAA